MSAHSSAQAEEHRKSLLLTSKAAARHKRRELQERSLKAFYEINHDITIFYALAPNSVFCTRYVSFRPINNLWLFIIFIMFRFVYFREYSISCAATVPLSSNYWNIRINVTAEIWFWHLEHWKVCKIGNGVQWAGNDRNVPANLIKRNINNRSRKKSQDSHVSINNSFL